MRCIALLVFVMVATLLVGPIPAEDNTCGVVIGRLCHQAGQRLQGAGFGEDGAQLGCTEIEARA